MGRQNPSLSILPGLGLGPRRPAGPEGVINLDPEPEVKAEDMRPTSKAKASAAAPIAPISKAKATDLSSQQGGLTPDKTSKKGGDNM